jgi:hypothetical protein
MRQLLTVCPFTCRLTLFQQSFSTVTVNGHNTQQPPHHMWDSLQRNSAKMDRQRVSIIPNTRSFCPRSPHCAHECFWLDQACSGGPHIRRRDASRFQQACWVVRADAAASVATTIALIEKVNLTNELKVVNIHRTKIMKRKHTFLARNVIKTHIHAQTNLKNDIIHCDPKECQPFL